MKWDAKTIGLIAAVLAVLVLLGVLAFRRPSQPQVIYTQSPGSSSGSGSGTGLLGNILSLPGRIIGNILGGLF